MSVIWEKVKIINDNGERVDAQAPIIISASRSTDIPAFYSTWFFERLKKGYLKWINPFNRKPIYISFKNTRLIVFWSKNPAPIIPKLKILDKMKINYYFQFTLNDYPEDLEPYIPPLPQRVQTFKELSQKIGKEKVIWRFDPIILTDEISKKMIIEKIYTVGEKIHKYTEKLVFSFVDIENYSKVKRNLKKVNIHYLSITEKEINYLSQKIGRLANLWKIKAATCAEIYDLSKYGIEHNRCVDDEIMVKLFHNDKILMKFLGYEGELLSGYKTNLKLKDKGQRKLCGCIASKDIGAYNTCGYRCIYCYANANPGIVIKQGIKRDGGRLYDFTHL